jgi:hypothetical protein
MAAASVCRRVSIGSWSCAQWPIETISASGAVSRYRFENWLLRLPPWLTSVSPPLLIDAFICAISWGSIAAIELLPPPPSEGLTIGHPVVVAPSLDARASGPADKG